MFVPVGGKKRKSQKYGGSRRIKRGGCSSLLPLSPAPFQGLDNTLPTGVNFQASPITFPSNQVGGDGYGYTGGKDVATFGGTYIPTARYTELGNFNDRGGNNFGMTGGKRSKHKRSTRKHTRSTRKHKRSKHKRSHKRGGSKKWKQIGCKRK
jgi:hypothetical protein